MQTPIAIVGIGCRYPGGVNDPDSFWHLLENGLDAISPVPADRWNAEAYYSPDIHKPGRILSRQGGFIENVAQFDADFFGIPPHVAAQMDPQQRLLLEIAWEALEDGGLSADRLAGTDTGVFVGISSMDYMLMQAEAPYQIGTYTMAGTILSMAANHLSHKFDWRGPSLVIDTACSSSLVAIHNACQSIWRGECGLAVAGGVQLQLKPETLMMYSKTSILSPSGRCYAFEARADGFARSEGAGLVILKPLAAAVADGDHIYAVIQGTAVNQDGGAGTLSEPNPAAQQAVIRQAHHQAGLSPQDIQYVETHGTGTPVGDPIEAEALSRVFGERPLIIGSVKTNIGHTEAAAGVAGLIKTVLALDRRRIPPHLHFETPNPNIPFEQWRLRVPTRPEAWPPNEADLPRLAGVSSFGIGGTNAHVVVAEAPSAPEPSPPPPPEKACLLPLSARSPQALRDLVHRYHDFLAESPVSLADVAYNAALRRAHHPHRLAVVGRSRQEILEKLRLFLDEESAAASIVPAQTGSVFVFSGMGQQWPGMGRELLATEPVFRRTVTECEAAFEPLIDWSLLEMIGSDQAAIDRTEIAQVMIFAIQVGLAALWQSWGIAPRAVVGHSVGEVAAAYVAGALNLAEAARVVFHRSRLQATTRGQGTMLAVALPAAEMAEWLHGYESWISIAAINSPHSVTLAGEEEALQVVAESFSQQDIFNRFLRVELPYHSPAMDPLVPQLEAALEGLSPQAASIPIYSTVTGQAISGPELDPAYWGRNMRQPVRFEAAISGLAGEGYSLFLEIGAHPVLVRSIVESASEKTALYSLRRNQPELAQLLETVGQLYSLGYPLVWERLYPQRRPFVRLPGYPWQRSRHWRESEERAQARRQPSLHPLLGRRLPQPRPAWQSEIDPERLPYLKDHRMRGAAIFPASGYNEMLLAAGQELFGAEGDIILSDVSLQKAFLLAEDGLSLVQTCLDSDQATLTIHSRPPEAAASGWTQHMTARYKRRPATEPPQIDLAEIRRRTPQHLTKEDCYRRLSERGYEYGPAFQGIVQGWRNETESLFEIEAPVLIESELADYHLHPALFDSYLHGVVLLSTRNATWLPIGAERLYYYAFPGPRSWFYGRLIQESDTRLEAVVLIVDEAGRVLIELAGLHYRTLDRPEATLDLRDHLYVSQWQALEPLAPVEPAAERWLILADRQQGVGQAIAERLRAQGGQPVLAFAGDSFEQPEPDHYRLAPDQTDHFRQLLAADRFDRVIYLWSLDGEEAESQAEGLLHLVQNLTDRPRLWLITNGLYEAKNIFQAPVWGLARTITNEMPHLQPRRVNLSREISGAEIEALFAELQSDSAEDEIVLRDEARYGLRLLPTGVGTTQKIPEGMAFRLETGRSGGLEGLVFRAAARSQPGPGQVELEIEAAALNFKDVVKVWGRIPQASLEKTYAGSGLGMECTGRVIAVGPEVDRFAPGDEVVGLAPHCFGSHTVTGANLLIERPAHLSGEEAAALPVVFTTAYYALRHLARLQPGERILIHAASGGVGQAAVRLAGQIGAEIFATAGNPEKREFLRSLGIAHVMDSRSLAFARQIMETTDGEGIDVVLNSLPGHTIPASLSTLRPLGRFVDLSNFYTGSQVDLQPFQRGLSLFAFDMDQLMQARPDYFTALFQEAMQYIVDHQLPALPYLTFPLAEAREAFRYMAQAKHIGKIILVRSAGEQPAIRPAPLEAAAFAGGTYLVTGGLRGFGLETAQWLVEHGAAHLVLVSRSGEPAPEARPILEAMQANGIELMIAQADVSQEAEVIRLLADIQASMPPLRGVFHAAAVYEDQVLVNLGPEQLRRVLAPKMRGAWYLHRHTEAMPLDYFVLYSSIASVFGSAGQGNYAAANQFLDTLAHHRHRLGRPALSVNWGGIDRAGYLARNTALGQSFADRGLTLVLPALALEMLGLLIQQDRPQITVAPVEWQRLAEFIPALKTNRFEELVDRTATEQSSGLASLADILAISNPAERKAALVSLLLQQTARLLGLSPDRISAETPLLQLGLDSLMAVELSNRLKRTAGLDISTIQLLGQDNLAQLADKLLVRLAIVDRQPAALPPLQPADRPQPPPLSFLQEPMWKLDRLKGGSPFYNIAALVHIRGRLETDILAQCFQQIIDRHENLRTSFALVDAEPVCIIAPTGQMELMIEELAGTSPDKARERAAAEAIRPFDLVNDHMIRALLLRLGPEEHFLVVTTHHIISDGLSMRLLLQELAVLYRAISRDEPTLLPDLPVQYADYAIWQRQTLAEGGLDGPLTYWAGQLAGGIPALSLPLDRPRPEIPTYQGGLAAFPLSSSLTDGIKGVARQEQCTLFTVLLAGLAVLTRRYSGLDSFYLGTFNGARPDPALENLVGCFINALPIRFDLAQNPTFRQLLNQSYPTILQAYNHSQLPFSKIAELARPNNPLQVALILHSQVDLAAGYQVEIVDGLIADVEELGNRGAKRDWTFHLVDGPEGLRGYLEYDLDLFDLSTIARVIADFQAVLAEVIANPDKPLGE